MGSVSFGDQAACAGKPTEWWFPPDYVDEWRRDDLVRQAKAICAICPVKDECEELGRRESYGVWGGIDREQPLPMPGQEALELFVDL